MSEPLGGLVLLHDGDYRFPKDLDVEDTWSVLEDQTEEYGHEVVEGTTPCLSIDAGDVRYDLLYTKPEEGVKAVAFYDGETDQVEEFYKLEELAEGDAE